MGDREIIELQEKRIAALREALARMTVGVGHSTDPGSYEDEAADALEADDEMAKGMSH